MGDFWGVFQPVEKMCWENGGGGIFACKKELTAADIIMLEAYAAQSHGPLNRFLREALATPAVQDLHPNCYN